MKAIITRSGKDFYLCQLEDSQRVEAIALPSLLSNIQPVVGDQITLRRDPDFKHFIIDEVAERSNEIYRLLVREKKKKVIAANTDLLAIVVTASKPKYKQRLLDRYLLRSVQWEVPVIVIFNKMDEANSKLDIDFERKRLDFLGVPTFTVSAHKPGLFEMERLKTHVKGKLSIFLGQSGVGKSNLISTLSGGEYDLLTGELAKVGKGAHTTTWAELIRFQDFSIIDSPGVRTMSMDDIFVENLPYYFQDLVPWLEKCQFTDCKHRDNSKGCGFAELNPENERDSIVISRFESFLKLHDELSEMPTWLRKKSLS